MIIPKKLKIGGLDWEITENVDVARQGQCFGTTHSFSQKIIMDTDSTEQKKVHTLIHEIMHAIWWQHGLSERFKDQPKLEEELVTTLSFGLHQVLKDNDLLK